MNQLIRAVATLLVTACLVQGTGAQLNVSGPGFLPDENGRNPDEPQVRTAPPSLATGTGIKDCAECPEMVVIPAGSFVMGSEKNANEKPLHPVVIPSFLLGKTEVTQGPWHAVMGDSPSYYKGQTLPVEQVAWVDIQQFISKLNQKTGLRYRLPSEAEWEYAARAGSTSEWSFGNDESILSNYAWYSHNSGHKTQIVGQKLANAFGLYDMHGNVWEWTQDCWHDTYAGAPKDGSAWTTACTNNYRVFRGGSHYWGAANSRSTARWAYGSDYRNAGSGFRLARDL